MLNLVVSSHSNMYTVCTRLFCITYYYSREYLAHSDIFHVLIFFRLEEGYKAPMKTYSSPIQIPASSTETITLKVIRPTQLMLRYGIFTCVWFPYAIMHLTDLCIIGFSVLYRRTFCAQSMLHQQLWRLLLWSILSHFTN